MSTETGTTATVSKKVLDYTTLTERLKSSIYPMLKENQVYVACARRVNSSKEGVIAIQVEYLERLPRPTNNNVKGINLTYLVNRDFDERFQVGLNVKRAWSTFFGFEALEAATGRKLSEEDKATLTAMEPGSDDRLIIMANQTYFDAPNGDKYQIHIRVIEVREDEMDQVQLSKSQRESLNHDSSFLMTGGDNSQFIVCADTGSKIRQITEITALRLEETLEDFHTYIPNKVSEDVFNQTSKANGKVVGKDMSADEAINILTGGKE